jgi:hypothetical protein
MKVLSIDVGIKNLALCLFDKPSDHYTITKWEVVNISEKDSVTCGFVDKKGLCNKPAKFKKDSKCFCLKHSKKQEYQVPTSELKSSYINKQKIQKLYDIAAKYNIKYETIGIYVIENINNTDIEMYKNTFNSSEPDDFYRQMMLYLIPGYNKTTFCPYWTIRNF